jgi:hypothetical protein
MPTLSWTSNITVSGGPTFSAVRQTGPVEAYDRIEVTIEPGASDRTVEIQPSAASRVVVLAVQSSYYDAKLSFKASDGATDSASVTLNEPQLFAGGGIALFGLAPTSLKFSNASADKTAVVDIFVARDATP